jgi:hypothetical protein
MSAYLVSRGHIRYLVEAALRINREGLGSYYHGEKRHLVTEETADAIGLMLWDECAKSVGYRYSDEKPEDLPGPCDDGPRFGYVHRAAWHHSFNPVEVLKSIRCYVYQSCEHAEWETSEAKAFCYALTIAAICRLPGWDAAPWGCPPSFEIERPKSATPNVVAFQVAR